MSIKCIELKLQIRREAREREEERALFIVLAYLYNNFMVNHTTHWATAAIKPLRLINVLSHACNREANNVTNYKVW